MAKAKKKKETPEQVEEVKESPAEAGNEEAQGGDNPLGFEWGVCQVDTSDEDLDNVDVSSEVVKVPEAAAKRVAPARAKRASRKSAAGTGKAEGAAEGKAAGPGKAVSQVVRNGDQVAVPHELGILPLRNAVVFPGTVIPLGVGRPRSQRLLSDAIENETTIGVLTQKNPKNEKPGYKDLYTVGTAVTILKLIKMPDGLNSVVVHGLVRFRVREWLGHAPYLRARIEVLESQATKSKDLDALVANIRQMALQMVQLSPNIPDEVSVVLNNIEDAGALADFLAANINIPQEKKQQLLELVDVNERLNQLSLALAGQLELLEMSAKIQQRVSESIDKTQREYYLQEQLKAIQTELGQGDQKSVEIGELAERIGQAKMPEAVGEEAYRELDRLSKIPIMSPEFGVLRSYIEWLCELPWSVTTKDKLSLPAARRILNSDHYGLVKIKKRILEFLAVRKLNPAGRSPILCFVGPPGVGKTSLGKSIARAMGRKFVRISLGGIRDEADIRGHRRTYIGALPGRILQELRKCRSANPVFMLDELDKIGQDFRGDPAAALLEVLDPEQNHTFTDHYIDQPFDLSRTMFIGTANYMGSVPPALRDRLEVIELPGYTAAEKLSIAKRYLAPRQLGENGLKESQLKIKDEALKKLIESYTREAGVRELERRIAAICRSTAAAIAGGERKSATVGAGQVARILGPVQYEPEVALRTSTPGVATGLAYTPVGGEVLFVESTLIPGSGKLILTGQLGDVMKESAQAAYSVLKSQAMGSNGKGKQRGIWGELAAALGDSETVAKQDLHVHVPAGAVPKDGPSAGLAIYTSIISLLTNHAVRADLAMTGEITLRGLVLPIGGVKEKLLAAKQAGIGTVILPERNRKDLVDMPRSALRGMKFEFVRRVDRVINIALENGR